MTKSRRTKRIHKGGRPRKMLPDIDTGTPELMAKRFAMASDPTLSTCPLDLALSKGIIDRDQHTAAGYYAACRALVFGSPHPKALDLLRTSGADRIPNASEAEAKYRNACADLRMRGPGVLEGIEDFVVHERFPIWLLRGTPSRARDRVMEGFAVLMGWYRGHSRRRAA
ncbi:MAG: hypothetical protein EPO08_17765 [Rhodospirillaceae bacterium]|nr:MAG: hypothetical protein EPO08_17765 [Rhodospirillaceae bacterium]